MDDPLPLHTLRKRSKTWNNIKPWHFVSCKDHGIHGCNEAILSSRIWKGNLRGQTLNDQKNGITEEKINAAPAKPSAIGCTFLPF